MNGQGRGCIPADHELAFARSRSRAFKEADLVIVVGTPFDFRLGFGESFAPGTKVVHLDSSPDLIAEHVDLAPSVGGPLDLVLRSINEGDRQPARHEGLDRGPACDRGSQARNRSGGVALDASTPIHPMRIYGELVALLDRDAIVIGDGGDFVSYAGREVPSYEPGSWLDPGPFGCLGVGPGYAMAARLAHPDRQVVLLYGDGALGILGDGARIARAS